MIEEEEIKIVRLNAVWRVKSGKCGANTKRQEKEKRKNILGYEG